MWTDQKKGSTNGLRIYEVSSASLGIKGKK
jgi:hypothetical protein